MTADAMTNDRARQKQAVRKYFDEDAVGYADAYDGPRADTRTDTFLERRERSLAALRTPLGRVLDIGAGPGVFTRALLERGATCWVVDLSADMMRAARRALPADLAGRAAFAVGDIERLPFEDETFDTVVCIGVLQYVDAVPEAFAELARVTRPGGQVLISFPNRQSPLNRLHFGVIAAARRLIGVSRVLGLDLRLSDSRLTFRSDVPNHAFSIGDIDRWARGAGLQQDFVLFHLLLFPFSVPGLGFLIRAWNRLVRGRTLRGPFTGWGREGIVRLQRA